MLARKKVNLHKANPYYIGLAIYLVANNLTASYANNIWASTGSAMITVIRALRYVSYAFFMLRILSFTRFSELILFFAAYSSFSTKMRLECLRTAIWR